MSKRQGHFFVSRAASRIVNCMWEKFACKFEFHLHTYLLPCPCSAAMQGRQWNEYQPSRASAPSESGAQQYQGQWRQQESQQQANEQEHHRYQRQSTHYVYDQNLYGSTYSNQYQQSEDTQVQSNYANAVQEDRSENMKTWQSQTGREFRHYSRTQFRSPSCHSTHTTYSTNNRQGGQHSGNLLNYNHQQRNSPLSPPESRGMPSMDNSRSNFRGRGRGDNIQIRGRSNFRKVKFDINKDTLVKRLLSC